MSGAPEKYLNVTVPEDIARVWRTWAGVEWRLAQHYGNGQVYPPDQRFSVGLPDGMCVLHRQMWLDWRDWRFNRHQFGSGPTAMGINQFMRSEEVWAFRRADWDEKIIDRMKLAESICLSGRSRQCDSERVFRSLPAVAA